MSVIACDDVIVIDVCVIVLMRAARVIDVMCVCVSVAASYTHTHMSVLSRWLLPSHTHAGSAHAEEGGEVCAVHSCPTRC